MKNVWRTSCAVVALAVPLVTSVANAQQSVSTLDRVEKSIPVGLFKKTTKVAPPASGPSIIVVGENHASVKTQQQLAKILETLYAAKLVDAVLIEGSNGPVPVWQIPESADTRNVASFWRGRLDLGQIAGYEYVALTQPAVTVFGVEDMKAKRDYTVGAASRGVDQSIAQTIEMHERAYKIAKDSLQQVSDGPSRVTAERELAEYRRRIGALIGARKTDGPRYAELEAKYTAAVEDLTLLYKKLQPLLPTFAEIATEERRYQKLLDQAKSLVVGSGDSNSAPVQKLLLSLQSSKARIEALTLKFESTAKQNGYRDGNEAISDLKKIGEVEAQLDPAKSALAKDLSAAAEQLTPIENKLTDQFFIVANSIREALGKPLPELQSFLHDERKRARERDTDPEVPYLVERDVQMVANTMQYLRNHPSARSVVLVVGYAHLGSITKRLSDAGAGVLAGRVAASRDETEGWEIRAWERRSRPAMRVFSKESARKELSRLLDSTFKVETEATLRKLEQLRLQGALAIPSGKARVFEVNSPGVGTKAVAVGNWAGMREANWGAHIVDQGYLPNSSANEQYLVFDRTLAKSQAKKVSTDRNLFVTSYRTRTGQSLVTRFETQAGPIGLEKFKAAPPKLVSGKTPARVVLLTEPDGGATYRSLQTPKAPMTATGDGGGVGEPPWTTALAGFAEAKEPGRRVPGLFQTINAERAKAKLDALDKQEPLRWGEIASLKLGFGTGDGSMLETLWFTPNRGDHGRAYLIVGENTEKFRSELKNAAEAGLFRNKQVALASCFDSDETPRIREMLLEAGALVVWTPERKITPEAAGKLETYLQRATQSAETNSPRTIDEAIPDALKLWHHENDSDPDLRSLIDASKWVRLFMPGVESNPVPVA